MDTSTCRLSLLSLIIFVASFILQLCDVLFEQYIEWKCVYYSYLLYSNSIYSRLVHSYLVFNSRIRPPQPVDGTVGVGLRGHTTVVPLEAFVVVAAPALARCDGRADSADG